jgi:hypothetical protein
MNVSGLASQYSEDEQIGRYKIHIYRLNEFFFFISCIFLFYHHIKMKFITLVTALSLNYYFVSASICAWTPTCFGNAYKVLGLVQGTSRSEEVDRVKQDPVLKFLEGNNSNAVLSLKL